MLPVNSHPSICQTTHRDETPALVAAAADHDVSGVRELLRLGADVNQTNERGQTALHVAAAAAAKREETTASPFNVVDLLIQHGADVNALDNERLTPLYLTT